MHVLYRAVLGTCVLLGAMQVLAILARLARFAWRHFARPAKPLTSFGKWAVVTGATDGIGRAYCDALAKRGLNIYLISRTEARLVDAAEQISSAYGVETKYFVADLAKSGAPGDDGACWFGLQSNLDGLDVGVLINNAGMSYEHPEFLHALDAAATGAIIAINAAALTQMVQVVLPGMKERGRGCVVNISSGTASALPACPLLSVYAATKAYVDTLTRSLAAEYAHFGVRFQAQAPNFVATKMAKMRRTSLMVPSPENASIAMMPEQVMVPYWFGMMSKMRAKRLKKKAAENKAQ